jgi:hypothetical protein
MIPRDAAKVEPKDWWAILNAIVEEMGVAIRNGVLKPPLRILVTDGDDERLTEFVGEIGANGKMNATMLSPDRPLTAAFPILYTVTDSDGKEMEAIFSKEMVSNLRRVS